MKFVFFVIGILLSSNLFSQEKELSLLFVGDIMGHDAQIASAKEGSSYSYDTCFSYLKPLIQEADIAIANLEVTHGGEPYKGYPAFSSPDALSESARDAGFDIMITANNHSLDRGSKGLERTITVLDSLDIFHAGTYRDEGSRSGTYPLIVEKNGIRLALLNYTYGTNGLKVREPNIVNYIDTALIRTDIQKAHTAEPDFIIVTIHWGTEYQRIQNGEQEKIAASVLNNGADAVIGSHPHVVQPIKTYPVGNEEKIVVYSLGNFISNMTKRFTDGGIVFSMQLQKTDKTRVTGYSYLPVWVYKPTKKGDVNHFILLPSNLEKEEYMKAGMNDSDFVKMKIFDRDTRSHLGEDKMLLPESLRE